MSRATTLAVAGAACLGLLTAALPASAATCVVKAGQGTGTTDEDAKSQAWEAVLQATSWPMWSAWMGAGMKVGTAPGYKVSGLKARCKAGGGLGRECIMQAKLCQ